MEKTITITKDMELPLLMALKKQKMTCEELRGFAADKGEKNFVQIYENEIQVIEQMLEKIGRAEWR